MFTLACTSTDFSQFLGRNRDVKLWPSIIRVFISVLKFTNEKPTGNRSATEKDLAISVNKYLLIFVPINFMFKQELNNLTLSVPRFFQLCLCMCHAYFRKSNKKYISSLKYCNSASV